MIDMDQLLRAVVDLGASDLHMTVGVPPTVRMNGILKAVDGYPTMTVADVHAAVERLLDEPRLKRFNETGDVDFSFGVMGIGRFRVNAFKQRGSSALCMRVISPVIPSFEELGLPPIVESLCNTKDGIILVTGPTGSGKSTTLAAMVEYINQNRASVIITIEDPIEYLHRHAKSIVNQREVGSDSESFATCLRAALREDPDVILLGEMRDLETIDTALKAAETGHLVLSTVHTRGAASTIDRIIDVFPPHAQYQARVQLAGSLRAVISQQLVPTLDGRQTAACEVMVSTGAIRNLVREGKTHQIDSVIETGARFGMQTMEASLNQLVRDDIISEAVRDMHKRMAHV